jgi:FAD/FMN-containing dehydrogenase
MHKLTRRQLLVGADVTGLGLGTGFRRGDWADLRASVRGRLLLPNAPEYPIARLASNSLYDDVVPQALLFCRDHGLQATARSGGHSYQGFSTSRGLVIDLAAMKSVALSADHGTVRIGAGARPITAPT